MAQAVRLLAALAAAAWLAWNVYRHVAVYWVRRRVVVVTDRVLGDLLAAAGALPALAVPSLPTAVAAALGIGAAVALRRTGLWIVIGASTERIFDRAALVLRGMAFVFDRWDGRSIEEQRGRIRIAIFASPTSLMHVLHVRPARGINKVALFRANLRKFLVAVPRQRRGGR